MAAIAPVEWVPLRFYSNSNVPLIGGKLFSYAAGTTTKQVTFTDSTGSTQNTNPIILDSNGQATVFIDTTKSYKFVLANGTDTDPPTSPIWTEDNVTGPSAASIYYTNSNTGAVQRTVQSKLDDFTNLKDFGAVGGTGWEGDKLATAKATGKAIKITGGQYNFAVTPQRFWDHTTRTVQASDAQDDKFLQWRYTINAQSFGGYGLGYGEYDHQGTVSATNDIGDAVLMRHRSVVNSGASWLHWGVSASPLNPASGFANAPLVTQTFAGVIGEYNPLSRHGDCGAEYDQRWWKNYHAGITVIPETSDFWNELGGARIGYSTPFSFAATKSPYTSTDTGAHAKTYNVVFATPNAIEANGAFLFATGYLDFITAVAISAGGTGYVVNDQLTFASGLDSHSNQDTVVEVLTVASGVITSVRLRNSGYYQQSFVSPVTVTGGTGTGATFTYTRSATTSAPRCWGGVAGRFQYGIDAGGRFVGSVAGSYTGRAVFTNAMFRAPSNIPIEVARNAADSADITFNKLNASDTWEISQIGTPALFNGVFGYNTGSGGAVTQATSKATGVPLNKPCGAITLNNASLAANTVVSFAFTNSTITANSIIRINSSGAATPGSYLVQAESPAAGSCTISVRNMTAGALAEALVLNFIVFAGAIS